MAGQSEQVAHAELVGGGVTSLHLHPSGINHALFGGYYPGVLNIGIKTTPQVEYRGEAWVLTTLSCRIAVPSAVANIKVQFRLNGSNIIGGEVIILAENNAGEITGLNIGVSDKDYFDIEIVQVGTTPNEGSDLDWQGLP